MPAWVAPCVNLFWFVALGHVVWFYVRSGHGVPVIKNGQYLVSNRGRVLRVLTQPEYVALKAGELRLFRADDRLLRDADVVLVVPARTAETKLKKGISPHQCARFRASEGGRGNGASRSSCPMLTRPNPQLPRRTALLQTFSGFLSTSLQ